MSASVAVGEVLRQPDDLVKLSAYRSKLLKEKASLDAKLAEGVRAQLDATRDALLKLQESRAAAGMIREEMIEIEKLKRDKDEGEAFDKITRVSGVHRNFAQTAKMITQLQSMSNKVDRITSLLADDRNQRNGSIGSCPNLLPIHFQLQQLEAFRNETLHEAKRGDQGDKDVLSQWFKPLDHVAKEFEAWMWEIAANIVELAREGYGGTIVRLLKIVDFEGKEDEKAVALRLVRKVAISEVGPNFRSTQANARVIKNYRHKLLEAMDASINKRYEVCYDQCRNNLLQFIVELDFIYDDIATIKSDVERLFPEDYEIVPRLIKRYHKSLGELLQTVVQSTPEAQVLLELHAWTKQYRQEMKKLDIPAAWLQPQLLDGRGQDLIEDYVRLIIAKLNEWTVNLQNQETRKFQLRTQEPDRNAEDQFGMDGVVDFFQLVNQQADLALDSNQGAVVARVVTESSKVMRRVQAEWVRLLADEARQQAERPEEVAGGLVEYVMALANDQLRAANYTETLLGRLQPCVSDKYKQVIADHLNEAIDGYLDVAKQCTSALVEFVFNDLRPATRALMTPQWYSDQLLTQIVETMRDYMADYQAHLSPSIFDILVEDLLDAFIIVYLTALHRAASRSLRMPAAVQRIRSDIAMAGDFFSHYKQPAELEKSLEVMEMVAGLVSASADMVFMEYWSFAQIHGPQLLFVEGLMRARDDLDRSSVSDIMETIKRKVKDEGISDPLEPTIMVKVVTNGRAGGLMANLSNLSSLANTYAGNVASGAGRMVERAGISGRNDR